MVLIKYLQNNPTAVMILIIFLACCCIVTLVIILLLKLETEKKVAKAALELRKITNSVKAGLVQFEVEDTYRIIYASSGFYDLLGYIKKEVKTKGDLSMMDFIYPKDIGICADFYKRNSGDIIKSEIRMVTKEGKLLYALVNGNCILSKDGTKTVSAVLVDITEQKSMQEMLLLESERYRIATELSNDVLFEYDVMSDEMAFTEKFKDMFGKDPVISEFNFDCAKRRDWVHPDDWGIYLDFCTQLTKGKSHVKSEFRLKDTVGAYIWCQAMGKTIYDDDKNPIRIIGKVVNVNIQKRELEALEYKATRDPLTGVYNKEVTIKKIDKYISGNRYGKHMLMFVDFDDFKKVNDNYGHLVGDKALTYVIGRIKYVFNEGEIIGRIGGDEFVVFSGNILRQDDMLRKAETLIRALNTTFTDDGRQIPISGSIGISQYPEDGLHYEHLMECADKALYRVKETGKHNYLLYKNIP